jgi:HD superfamily phosphodiesterase
MLDFKGAKKYIINRLEKDLNLNLYYHGLHHTLDVYEVSVEIAKREGISEENTILLNTAALYHDAGFLFRYLNNEVLAVKLVKEILPLFGYKTAQIKIICDIILTTRIEKRPKTLLEKVMCDSDYDYLGRGIEETLGIAKTLNKELSANGFTFSEQEWNNIQLKFLKKHEYYTQSSLELRRSNKLDYYEYLKSKL